MGRVWGMTLLLGVAAGLFTGPSQVFAQACKDEVSMVEGSTQALTELRETVKKETLTDFQSLNHQKSALNKLAIHDSMLGDLVGCLEKAAEDTTAPKEQAGAAKAQHDASAKLLEKVQQEENALKAAKLPKDAKGLVEKLDLTS